MWRRDGRELFYVAEDRMMAVDVDIEPRLDVGPPRQLFSRVMCSEWFEGERAVPLLAKMEIAHEEGMAAACCPQHPEAEFCGDLTR